MSSNKASQSSIGPLSSSPITMDTHDIVGNGDEAGATRSSPQPNATFKDMKGTPPRTTNKNKQENEVQGCRRMSLS
ncbi:hypothetical protein NL676_014415 [Syzygium grande]|nr:hypothetical protein NL676_014415 [Syzygium grande]